MHSAGAKFDYEKAKWFNAEWIKKLAVGKWQLAVKEDFNSKGITIDDNAKFEMILNLVKERCPLLTDFYIQASFFYKVPETLDVDAIKPKWSADKNQFFVDWIVALNGLKNWDAVSIENSFKELAIEKAIKPGELQLPFRIMLVGGKFGPPVVDIAAIIGKEETVNRINYALNLF